MSAPIIAYQLSLLGDPPKAGRAWRRAFWQMRWCGIGMPLPEGAERQAEMLTADTRSFDARTPEHPEMAPVPAVDPSRSTPDEQSS